MSDYLKLIKRPILHTCPLCHCQVRTNLDMVSIACDVRGVEHYEVVNLLGDVGALGERLDYPPCWFHQAGKRMEPMPWSATCEFEGNSSTPPDDAV